MFRVPDSSTDSLEGRFRGITVAMALLAAAIAAFAVLKLASTAVAPTWIYEVDLRGYFFPGLVYERAQLLRGTIPLWAPGQLLGVPFAAALQPAVFYPLLLPFVVTLQPEHALVAHALLHLLLAGLFVWVYLRTLGVAAWGALIGALAFLFSPDLTNTLYTTAYLSNQVWLPALVAAVHLVTEKPTARRCAALAAVTAMLFLSGYAQGAVYSLQCAGLYGVRSLAGGGGGVGGAGPSQRAGVLAAGVALGSAVAAIQLLPTLELAADGVRSLGGLNILRAGGIGGEEAASAARYLAILLREAGGPAGVLLMLAAAFDRPRRGLLLLFAALLLVTCDFQRGNAGFVFPLYYRLPTGNLFQVPARIAFVTTFAVAVLSGAGAAVLLRVLPRRWTPAALAMLAVLVVWPRWTDAQTPHAWPPVVDAASLYGDPAVVAVATKAADDDRYRVLFLQHPQEQRIPPRAGLLLGLRVFNDYEPLLPGSYRRFFSVSPDIRWRGRLTPVEGAAAARSVDFPVDLRVLDSLAVRHYVNARANMAGRPPTVTERATAKPRAYAVDHVSLATNDEEALAILHARGFDWKNGVVITSAVPLFEETPEPLDSDVRIVVDDPDEVTIEASCSKPCAVVLSDLAYPGWEAEVDGRAALLLKANSLLRAVAVPAGNHTVRYRYRPASFRFGAGISAAAVLLLLSLLVAGRRSRSQAS